MSSHLDSSLVFTRYVYDEILTVRKFDSYIIGVKIILSILYSKENGFN